MSLNKLTVILSFKEIQFAMGIYTKTFPDFFLSGIKYHNPTLHHTCLVRFMEELIIFKKNVKV